MKEREGHPIGDYFDNYKIGCAGALVGYSVGALGGYFIGEEVIERVDFLNQSFSLVKFGIDFVSVSFFGGLGSILGFTRSVAIFSR